MESHDPSDAAGLTAAISEFFSSFDYACTPQFLNDLDALCARYEHQARHRQGLGQLFAEENVNFEADIFPHIDAHAEGFLLLLAARRTVGTVRNAIRKEVNQYARAIRRLTRAGAPFSAATKDSVTAEWDQVRQIEYESLLLYSLLLSGGDQVARWRHDRGPVPAAQFPPLLWAHSAELVRGDVYKDWHKHPAWQQLEHHLLALLQSRGLSLHRASLLMGFTWQYFFPNDMTGTPAAIRLRWRRAQ